jgi:hypothetical protein
MRRVSRNRVNLNTQKGCKHKDKSGNKQGLCFFLAWVGLPQCPALRVSPIPCCRFHNHWRYPSTPAPMPELSALWANFNQTTHHEEREEHEEHEGMVSQ